MAIETLQFSIPSNWTQFARDSPWAAFVPETAQDESGQKYMRNSRGTSKVVYKVVEEDARGNQEYQCAQCGSDIQGAT